MIPVILRFWLLRRNNIITKTEIKQLKPYMYQLISFKIILHLHLLLKKKKVKGLFIVEIALSLSS